MANVKVVKITGSLPKGALKKSALLRRYKRLSPRWGISFDLDKSGEFSFCGEEAIRDESLNAFKKEIKKLGGTLDCCEAYDIEEMEEIQL